MFLNIRAGDHLFVLRIEQYIFVQSDCSSKGRAGEWEQGEDVGYRIALCAKVTIGCS